MKDKSKKGGLFIHKKTTIGKNRVLTKKQSKKDMKILNPKIRSEGMSLNVFKPDPNLRRPERRA
jgi:hypothetical protein